MVAGRCAPGNGPLPLSLPSRWDLGAQRLGNPTLDATCSPDNRRKRRYQGRRASAAHWAALITLDVNHDMCYYIIYDQII